MASIHHSIFLSKKMLGPITITSYIIFALLIIFIVVWVYLSNKKKPTDTTTTSSTGFFRGGSIKTLGIVTGILLLASIILLVIFWPEYLYYAYIAGGLITLLLIAMINPAGLNKLLFGLIAIVLLGASGALFYFGIKEILIAAQLGSYDSTTGTNERLS